ncbi:uncharacterized protein LOC131957058, partial [Physella acuta]|uniref:uncharacterized protein LOC131957058 n=1 Tax=Physella acuta TaxID=109671 RepID=UPI0027DE8D78
MAECLDLLAVPSRVTWIFLILAVCTMATDNHEPLLPSAPAKGAPPVKKSQGDPDFFPGLFNGMIYTPPDKDTTTRLPEFVPDGPRPFIPDPSFMPGETEIVVHSGERAILPCMVQHLGTRQVTWTKTGIGHFLSIGTDIWAPDPNLRISHYSWPAGVSAWNMVINEVKMADAGEYQCAIIATEKMVWKVNLTVV